MVAETTRCTANTAMAATSLQASVVVDSRTPLPIYRIGPRIAIFLLLVDITAFPSPQVSYPQQAESPQNWKFVFLGHYLNQSKLGKL